MRWYKHTPAEHEQVADKAAAAFASRDRVLRMNKEDLLRIYSYLMETASALAQQGRERLSTLGELAMRSPSSPHGNGGRPSAFAIDRERRLQEERLRLGLAPEGRGVNAFGGQIRSNGAMGEWVPTEAWQVRNGSADGEPLVSEEKTLDPMAEAEAAFGAVAETSEQLSVEETKRATERLKDMYHALMDVQHAQTAQIRGASETIRALRDENYAIACALREKHIELEAELDPLRRPLQVPESGEKEEHTSAAGEEVHAEGGPAADGGRWLGRSNHQQQQQRVDDSGGGAPPPGVAGVSALLSLAKRQGALHAGANFRREWSAEEVEAEVE